ncbi:hypothetical protein TMCBR2_gp023 [Caulobacter phage TMCBR2]|uniref:Uncharacterized protein n=1 Tax=Caulobacter phage TMCBR2 TaxID=3025404 RepID=A0AAF0BWL7_9CAUD|nr:hypothetical protein TMCBR2_gp023 [Caulobacter phage TMCBR2]WDS38271.1 hypothetical protein TMCBR3_gp023 [Caulobacter phage TMCBR3]
MAAPLLPPEIDPQDPLPDSSFLWRRVWTYALCVLLWVFAYTGLWRMPRTDVLEAVKWAFGLTGFAGLLYMAGASTKEITALLATLKLRLRGPRPKPAVDPTPSPAQAQATEDELK